MQRQSSRGERFSDLNRSVPRGFQITAEWLIQTSLDYVQVCDGRQSLQRGRNRAVEVVVSEVAGELRGSGEERGAIEE